RRRGHAGGATRARSSAGRFPRGDRRLSAPAWPRDQQYAPTKSTTAASAATAAGEVACAPGSPPKPRAQPATNHAPTPLTCASAAATGGATGAMTAVASATTSISATIGTATTFAGTVTIETWWNCSHVTGAVARPQAVDTPISCASPRGTG